jgi:5-methylcytosine-specific restriction endonuclease McrA
MSRISETELVLPALFVMSMQSDGKITTSKLIQELQRLLKPTGQDAQILAGRKDTYFSQKVRNLKSHNTFARDGYADRIYDGFQITPKGREFVEAKQDVLGYMFASTGFNYTDILKSCDDLFTSDIKRKVIPLTEFIREGSATKREVIIRERSTMLRDAAREYFRNEKDGLLYCNCCNFEFAHQYNPELYSSCIEIHHIKPLYQYEDEDMDKTIQLALQNLMPVCPNCHKIIHKHHIGINEFDILRQNVHLFQYK